MHYTEKPVGKIISTACLLILLVGFSVQAQLPDQFQKVELIQGLTNSINFEFAPDGRIFIVDRYGELLVYDPNTLISTSAGEIPVFHELEDGLLGIEFDPNFLSNNHIYLHYSPVTPSVNRVSRFTMTGNTLNLGSEVVLLEWPTQREICCHAAGDMDFDSQGNLYIAIGDNTTHSDYATLDEVDSNKSSENTSSNTNDLRGKILRITPQPDGSYTIPTGNLFPGGSGGLPEIYVMGARNPFKIFVDRENTDWLFWGEVGPDANDGGIEGPEGLDEINLTKASGNYGWPYLSGDNLPYRNNYASQPFYYDPLAPVNLSQWNTGATDLPAAQPAWLSFFHECYLAGPRYYYDPTIADPRKLPIEFDQALFYYDFNTSRVWVVQMDALGNILSNDRLAPAIFNVNKNGFIDLKIGPDGHLYILEYGEGCCPDNVGSGKLVRVDYTGIASNSSPVVQLSADPTNGSLPLVVDFSSAGTIDPDGDPLTFEWDFDGDGTVDSNQENPSHTYNTAGTFNVLLKVSDDQGGISTNNITIYAGNHAAEFTFLSPPDGGLIGWDDDIQIEISATDEEDGAIDCGDISLVPSIGHLNHFHDDLTSDGCAHTMRLDPQDHDIHGEMDIFYVLGVNYTDQGGLTSFDQVRLHPKRKEAEFFDSQQDVAEIANTDAWGGGTSAIRVNHGSYIVFEGRNLSGINSVRYRVASGGPGGNIELRIDSPDGNLLSSTMVSNTGGWDSWTNVESAINDPGGKHDLYFVFTGSGGTEELLSLNWVEFAGEGVSVDTSPPDVESITVNSTTSISVEFTEPVTQSSAENISSYQIDQGILVSNAVLQEDGRTVVITINPISAGVSYNLFINGVQNLAGIDLVPGNYSFSLFETIRINAGGPQLMVSGETFSADQYAATGEIFENTVGIDGTAADALYQTERWGNFTYDIPVSQQGIYDIRLHFAEIYYGVEVNGGAGSRVFNVSLEGSEVLSNFDILTEVPAATALVKELNDIPISDGLVTLQFTGVTGDAKISAIEILDPNTFSATPNITILTPQNGASVNQPFSIGFSVTNWEVAEESTHLHYFIDGQMIEPYYSLDPITIDGLGLGTHTIRLELFEANHTGTGIFDEVTVTITDQMGCLETDFPDQWAEHLIDEALPYRSVYILPQQDIDGDGLKDIVTGGWWYKNPGNAGGNWEQHTIGSPFNNVAWIYDFDGDGDQDLFGSQGAYESKDLAWAQNDGNGNFTVHTNIPSGTTNFGEIFIAGIAGGVYQTGGPYQLAITWNGAEDDNSQIQLITVPADPVNTSWTIENLHPNSLGEAITAGDIDGDGDLDLFQTENWLRNDQGSWTLFNTGITYTSHADRNALADFDGDGDLDGVAGQLLNNREIAWFEAPDDPTQLWTKHQIHPSIDGSLSVGVADMDFDGDPDIVVGEWKGAFKLFGFENDLCNTGTWVTHTIDQGGNGLDHHDGSQLVDIDNDGDLDIITIGWDNITPRIFENLSDPVVQNLPPVITSIPNQSYQTGGSVSLQVGGEDPNPGDVLTFSATGLPTDLTIDETSGLISGLLTATVGDYQVTVRLTDQDGLFDEETFTINITSFSGALRINSGGPGFSFEGVAWSADQYFNDGTAFSTVSPIAGTSNDQLYQTERYAESGTMDYAIPLASGDYQVRLHFAEIYHTNAGARVFNVDIESGQAQLNNYDIFVAAGAANTAVVEEFMVTVLDGFLNINFTNVVELPKISGIEINGLTSDNLPPQIDPIVAQTVAEGGSLEVQINSQDPEGDTPTLTVDFLPPFASFADNMDGTGSLFLNPGSTDIGTYNVTVTATDSEGLSDSERIIIQIVEEDTTPEWVVFGQTSNANCLNENGSILLTVTGGIGDLSYEWSNGEQTSDITNLSAGDYTVTITDQMNNSTTESFTINLQPGPPKPSISQDGDFLTTTANAFSYQWLLDGEEIPGETDPTIKAELGGEYSVIISDELGCTVQSDSYIIQFHVSSMSVYPNPTDGSLILNLVLVEDQEISLVMVDDLGRDSPLGVFNLKAGRHRIDLSLDESLANGVYTIMSDNSDFRNNTHRILIIR